jgi:hypothetical protein
MAVSQLGDKTHASTRVLWKRSQRRDIIEISCFSSKLDTGSEII